MTPTPCTPRLFAHGPAVTPHESGVRKRANQRAQTVLFDPAAGYVPICPACAAPEPDDCTCARTGAEALTLL